MTEYYERKPKRGQKRTKNQKRRDARWMAERRRRDREAVEAQVDGLVTWVMSQTWIDSKIEVDTTPTQHNSRMLPDMKVTISYLQNVEIKGSISL